jgi:hypothetical protein
LAVPARSQRVEDPALAGRICSPTSVAMVMAYRGIERPTIEVARAVYDRAYDIYGNWPRAIQAAYAFGVPGYLRRFSSWAEVERCIADDQPLVISIRFKEGALAGAPISSSDGHIIVLAGFDADGNVEVNDPAFGPPASGRRRYARADLERAWLRATAGTAYVLSPRDR